MKVTKGIWEVQTGKGNRVYISCTDRNKIMHPQLICSGHGLGIYGIEHLTDLASAITELEQLKDVKELIYPVIRDLVTNFLYYDRKDDEELDRDAIPNAIENGGITEQEIVYKFAEYLKEGLGS